MSTTYSFGWIKRNGEWICNLEHAHQAQQATTSHQEEGAPLKYAPQQADILALALSLSHCTLTLLDVIHGLSLYHDALTAHVLDRYNLLNERILDLASQFLPPLNA
ncbi:hypothetical protein J1N35_005733 [Gossypium stocksii]|uniref:Uncharacterized protein n=1 Tax=Gossypium stocksii TaxID=47602 RepID=A0A9D3WFT6_9ROSI|nr:hypothetical protein J1N35_005733 [Gossypium stocksii]